jgi:hypothetical protein
MSLRLVGEQLFDYNHPVFVTFKGIGSHFKTIFGFDEE